MFIICDLFMPSPVSILKIGGILDLKKLCFYYFNSFLTVIILYSYQVTILNHSDHYLLAIIISLLKDYIKI